ncbi:GNAT family N-acetyltransferase [Aliikangiella coralliicola]|uniref:GNAT family N-acetyltransferase n=1 Tax=Aliikangiella coralliicola TaxID=2592383 RepID=A0A545U663_9GAMM|nr:GNAT family N-acetyltransferase [Aliikangiella coralliicola]TQV84914.1 GNAT family N-acetyltransferase [Aliikangiella coralliicola]
MNISQITEEDFKSFWPTLKLIIEAEETYAFDPQMSFEQAHHLWCGIPQVTYVAKEDDVILGSYYLKPNMAGPGSHVCNCGYMVTPAARGKGVARRLCEHSQDVAKELGYLAMQFNSVVSSNDIAVKLWQKLGYEIIGTIPQGFRHKKLGLVDSYIMYKQLNP